MKLELRDSNLLNEDNHLKGLFFPCGSDSKESACNAGDPGLVPGSGRSPREGNGTPLQYSCLENSMDRGAWPATVHGVAKSWTPLSDTVTFSQSLYYLILSTTLANKHCRDFTKASWLPQGSMLLLFNKYIKKTMYGMQIFLATTIWK